MHGIICILDFKIELHMYLRFRFESLLNKIVLIQIAFHVKSMNTVVVCWVNNLWSHKDLYIKTYQHVFFFSRCSTNELNSLLLSQHILNILYFIKLHWSKKMGKIQTVLSAIDTNSLGKTLTHEHLVMNYEKCYMECPENLKELVNKKMTLESIGFVRQYPYACKENLRLNDLEARAAILKDVHLYKKFGGGAIAENTTYGLNRDLEFIVDVAKKTDVHIIAGTGHYLHFFQEPSDLSLTVEELTELYSTDIIEGKKIGSVDIVKCGFIGEIASEYPIHEFEKKTIRAAGEAQEVVGCGVSFHPGRNKEAPFEIMRLYLEAGGKANKCVMSHLDRTFYDMNNLLEFSKFGSYLQYDLFGTEISFYQFSPNTDMPSDGQRLNYLKKLIEEGLIDRITLSHDIHTKHRLTSYGGHGFHHLHTNVLPRLLQRGLTSEDVERLSSKNPAEWLSISL